jgi:hypothetical protein
MSTIPSDILQQNLGTISGLKRRTVRVQSDVSNYNYGQKVIINFPSQLCDLRRSYLSFFAQLTLNGGTFAGFSYPLSTLFSRLRILVGSQVVTDIDDLAALMGIFKLASSNQSVVGFTGDGTYTQATRRTESTTGRLYEVKFDIDFLERIVPVDRIRGGMRLELTVGQAANCLEYDGGIPVLTLNQVYYNFYQIEATSEINQMIDGLITSGQYVIRGWNWNTFTGQTAAIASSQLQLPFKFKCIRGILAGYRDNADVSDATAVTKFTDNWDQDGIQSINLKINTEVFPVEGYPMNYPVNQLPYLLTQRDFASFMNRWYNSHYRQLDTFGAASPAVRFMTAFDTRMDSTSEAWGNGINTADGNTNQIVNVTFLASPGALYWNIYCCYQTDVLIGNGGNVVVSF